MKINRQFEIGRLNIPNPGILIGRMPLDLFSAVERVVKNPSAKKLSKANKRLVGVIEQEYDTPIIPELNLFVDSMYETYCTEFEIPRTESIRYSIWTNYMKRGEFNPNHCHPGALLSFVLWVQISYDLNKEREYANYGGSESPKTSCFEITYSTLPGKIAHHAIPVDQSMEGVMIMFPGDLTHSVYPFFSSDEERISIAGNIYSQ